MSDIQMLVNTGREALQSAVAEGDEFMPILIVKADGFSNLIALAVDDDPVSYLPLAMEAFKGQRIESVSFTSDTFHATDSTVPRPLSAAWAAGDPRVSEALAITIVTASPETDVLVLLPYTRFNLDVVWGTEVQHQGAGLSGRVTEFLRRAIRAGGAS